MKKVILATVMTMLGFNCAAAESSKTNALNFCPLAVPILNLYALNMEALVASRHGIGLRIDYAPLTENNIDITNQAVILNYRWHFQPSMDSLFAGPYLRYRKNSGSGTAAGIDFDYDSTEVTWGVNIGKRWTWKNGFNLVAMGGYGYSDFSETISKENPSVEAAMSEFKKGVNDIFFDDPFYGELSIGYAF